MKNTRQCKRWRLCPLCWSGDTVVINHQEELNRRWFELRRKADDAMGIRKPDVIKDAEHVFRRDRSSDDWLLYPTLMEYLAEDRYEDGSARRTATLTLFADAGQIKCSLNDRDVDRVAFVSAETIEALLGVLEAKLKESSIEWRDGKAGGRRKK